MNSREKGAAGERELAAELRKFGFDAKRGQQYCGLTGAADVVGVPGIHIECKRVERLNIHDAYDQACRDAKCGEFPAVFHRKNGKKWLVTMSLPDWVSFYNKTQNYNAEK